MIHSESTEKAISWYELGARSKPSIFFYLPSGAGLAALTPELARREWVLPLVLLVFGVLSWLRFRASVSLVASQGRSEEAKAAFDRWVVLAGASWGVLASATVVLNEEWQQLLALLLTVVLTGGAISSLLPDFGLFFRFWFLAAELPVAALALTSDDIVLISISFITGCVICLTAWNNNANYWRNLTTTRSQMRELERARSRLELVLEGSELGMFDWFPQDRKISLDRKIADVLGLPARDFEPFEGSLENFTPDDAEALKGALVAILKDGESRLRQVDCRFRNSEGEIRWFSFRGRVVQRDSQGRAQRVTGTYQHITERKKSEEAFEEMRERVEQSGKLKTLGVLAGGVAHDFNNLLMAVHGNLELAEFAVPEGNEGLEHLGYAREACMDAARLCDQLLAYAGQGKLKTEVFNLNQLLEDMLPLLKLSATAHFPVEMKLEPELPDIDGDVDKIRQVIMSLVTNAAEAMEDKGDGTIFLQTSLMRASSGAGVELPEAACVCLTVTDQGCGMDERTLKRIYDPFFTTKFTGRGLGLASVIGIIRSHGGDISVQSEVGEGTTFRLLLPPKLSEPSGPGQFEQPSVERATSTILVVDDEETVRRITERFLSQVGHQVLTAEDGVVALQQIEEHDGCLSLVILDLTMPKKDGFETLREIRQRWPRLPVILCSGYSEVRVMTQESVGAQGFLKKPFSKEQLLEAVESVQG